MLLLLENVLIFGTSDVMMQQLEIYCYKMIVFKNKVIEGVVRPATQGFEP